MTGRDAIIRDGARIAARILAGEHIAAVTREYGNHPVIVRRVYHQHTTRAQRRSAKSAKLAASLRRSGRAFTGGEHRQPLGTITIHRTTGGVLRRQIKVDERGPSRHHWMFFATFLWLAKENRAQVPRGFRVAHADGDTLNDDPSNLMLMREDWAFEHVRCLHPEAEELRLSESNKGAKTRAKHRAILESLRREAGGVECAGCGHDERPSGGRCPKCNGSAWNKVRRVAA